MKITKEKIKGKNLSAVLFLIGIFLIGLLKILQGAFNLNGSIGELRGFSTEKKSYDNLLGMFLLIFSLFAITFSLTIQLFSIIQDKTIIPLFLQVISLSLITLAGLSYLNFAHEAMKEILKNQQIDNLRIADSGLLGAFGFIIFLIFLGFYISITNIRKKVSKESNNLLIN